MGEGARCCVDTIGEGGASGIGIGRHSHGESASEQTRDRPRNSPGGKLAEHGAPATDGSLRCTAGTIDAYVSFAWCLTRLNSECALGAGIAREVGLRGVHSRERDVADGVSSLQESASASRPCSVTFSGIGGDSFEGLLAMISDEVQCMCLGAASRKGEGAKKQQAQQKEMRYSCAVDHAILQGRVAPHTPR